MIIKDLKQIEEVSLLHKGLKPLKDLNKGIRSKFDRFKSNYKNNKMIKLKGTIKQLHNQKKESIKKIAELEKELKALLIMMPHTKSRSEYAFDKGKTKAGLILYKEYQGYSDRRTAVKDEIHDTKKELQNICKKIAKLKLLINTKH